jgi:hypothetical protein
MTNLVLSPCDETFSLIEVDMNEFRHLLFACHVDAMNDCIQNDEEKKKKPMNQVVQ